MNIEKMKKQLKSLIKRCNGLYPDMEILIIDEVAEYMVEKKHGNVYICHLDQTFIDLYKNLTGVKVDMIIIKNTEITDRLTNLELVKGHLKQDGHMYSY